MRLTRVFVLAALLVSCACAAAQAAPLAASPVYAPSVPVDGLAFPSGWFDASRLHFSQSFSFGSGGGYGSNALSVTSLSYQLSNPLSCSVSLGNAWGGGARQFGGTQNSTFLEGFNVRYRPNPAFEFQVQYQNVRSPLQYGYADRFSRWNGLP